MMRNSENAEIIKLKFDGEKDKYLAKNSTQNIMDNNKRGKNNRKQIVAQGFSIL